MKFFIDRLLILIVCSLFITNVSAAAGSISYIRFWSALIKNGYFKDHPRWLYTFIIEGRFTNQPGLFYQGLAQAQLGYQASPRIKLWLGYSWLPSTTVNNTGRVNSYNQRIYQQVDTELANNSNNLLFSRTRMEERQENGQAEINWRFRQLIEWDIPALTIHHQYRPFLSNELFLNVNNPTWVNQNRFMAGIDFPCFSTNVCRVAYLNQYIIQQPKDVMSHILYTNLTF